jgi:hypothetical protein
MSGARRAFSFLAGIFLVLFIVLGYETNQISLIGLIFYNLIAFFYGVAGFILNRYIAMPVTLHGITTFVVVMALLFAVILIVTAIFGGNKKSSK